MYINAKDIRPGDVLIFVDTFYDKGNDRVSSAEQRILVSQTKLTHATPIMSVIFQTGGARVMYQDEKVRVYRELRKGPGNIRRSPVVINNQ